MATYRKRGSTWRAEIAKNGARLSGTFESKAEAVAWAREKEAELGRGGMIAPSANKKTFADALRRYQQEVSPTKRGARWEILRLAVIVKLEWTSERIGRVTPDHVAKWRDGRLETVKPSTVNRELNLISAVFEHARREWKWIVINPVRDVRRPTNPRPRDRRITQAEENTMLRYLGYERDRVPITVQQHLAAAFLLALETGMRQGEILGLTWDRVFIKQRFVRLEVTKNGDVRNVPLSSDAVRLLELQPRLLGETRCFQIESASADALWRKARNKAKIKNLRFHDSRHEAITRLAKKLDVLDLARMIGHRDPKSLMIYYNATASELASRLG
jgi:integrase